MSVTITQVCERLNQKRSFEAAAYLVAEKVNFTPFGKVARGNPAMIATAGAEGLMIGYHFGVVVFFNLTPTEKDNFLQQCADQAIGAYEKPIFETCEIQVINSSMPDVVKEDVLHINEASPARLELVGDVLAKSIILEKHEELISERFEQVKPIANNVISGKIRHRDRELLRYLGQNLVTEYELAGLAEVSDKPALLWEQPDLEVLYNVLLDDFEILERQNIIDKKLETITRTAQTYLDVSMHQHGLRLEWYIIILIAIEILLQLYELFL